MEFSANESQLDNLIFGDFASPQKDYIKVENMLEHVAKFNDYLVNYNVD